MINNHYGLIRNTRGHFMDRLKCLNISNKDSNIFQKDEYIDNIIYDLEKIHREIHKACIEDDAVKLSENILLKTSFKDKNIYSKSPLQLFKIGRKDEAFKLADLFFSEDRYLWYLLFIWYLKINKREQESNEVIEKMIKKKVVSHDGWIGDATNIIYKQIIDINPDKLTKIYFTYFCGLNSYSVHEFSDMFLKRGFYEQAIEAANYLIKTALRDEELYGDLLDKYKNAEFTMESVNHNTKRIVNEAFSELINEAIKECLSKNQVKRAERLVSNIYLDWAKVDGLLKISEYYCSIGDSTKMETTLREASESVTSIKDVKKRKNYINRIVDKCNKEKVININGDNVDIEKKENKEELDKFTDLFNNYILKKKKDKYVELITELITEEKVKEAEKVLDTLPYDYDNWDIVRLIQENYILLGDFHSAIAVNEKYQYKISRLHGITFILDKVIKCGIDKEIALSIMEKNILDSYKPCIRWNKCEELFRIAYIQGINGYKKEAKNSAELGLKVLETICKGRSEFLKLAVRALATAEEYDKALELIENDENESIKSYSYIELAKILVLKKEYIKACEIIDKIQNKEHKSAALAEKALVHLKMNDEINSLKSLNSCYKLLQADKSNISYYLKKIFCEIEAINGNIDKAIEMIKEIIYMQDEAIESILGYVDSEEKLYELLKISNNIDIKFDGYSYVNAHLLIANSFKKLGNLKMYNEIKSDMGTLVHIESENIWKDRIEAYVAKAELFSGDINNFLKLSKDFSESFKGELYSIVDIFNTIKDKSVFKEFICSVDFTKKEAYHICEIVATLYPESSNRIAELIYQM